MEFFVLLAWSVSVSGKPSGVMIPQCSCTPSQKCQPNSALYEGEHVLSGRESPALPQWWDFSALCWCRVQSLGVSCSSLAADFAFIPPPKAVDICLGPETGGGQKSFLIYHQWFKDFVSYELRVQGSGRVSRLYATEEGSLCSQFLLRASVNDKEHWSEDSSWVWIILKCHSSSLEEGFFLICFMVVASSSVAPPKWNGLCVL